MRKFLFALCIVFLVAATVLGFYAFTSVQSYTLHRYKEKSTPLVISKKVNDDFTVMSLDERQTVINAYQDFTFDTIYSNRRSFSVSYGKPSPSTINTPSYYSSFAFSGCMSVNQDTLKRYGYSMAYGSLPQKDNQVCITQFAFDVYKTLGYARNEISSVAINRYADIIGKKISIDNYDLEISGVIDTKLDKQFDILKEDIFEHKFLKSTKSIGYFSIFPDIRNTSPHTALFISEYMTQDLFEMPYIVAQFTSLLDNKSAPAISYSYAEVRQPQITWADGKQALDTGEIILDKKLFRTLMLEKYGGIPIWSEEFNGATYNESTLTDDILLQMLDSKPILMSSIRPDSLNLTVVGIWDNGQTLNNYGCIISNNMYLANIDSAEMPDASVVALVTSQQKKAANNSPLFNQSVSLDDGYAAVVPYIPDKIISLQRTIIWTCFFACIVVSMITAIFAIRKRS